MGHAKTESARDKDSRDRPQNKFVCGNLFFFWLGGFEAQRPLGNFFQSCLQGLLQLCAQFLNGLKTSVECLTPLPGSGVFAAIEVVVQLPLGQDHP